MIIDQFKQEQNRPEVQQLFTNAASSSHPQQLSGFGLCFGFRSFLQ
jgi:hypothetical protein